MSTVTTGEVVEVPRARWEAYSRIVNRAVKLVATPREWAWLQLVESWRLGREVEAAREGGHLDGEGGVR